MIKKNYCDQKISNIICGHNILGLFLVLLHHIGFNTVSSVSIYTTYSTRSAAGTLAHSPANHTAKGVEFMLMRGCSQDKWAVFEMHGIRI